jgi:hypothetical protein
MAQRRGALEKNDNYRKFLEKKGGAPELPAPLKPYRE